MNELMRMMRRALKQRTLAVLATVMTLAQCAMTLRLPMLMADIVNNGVLQGSMEHVRSVSGRMLLVCVLMGACGYGANQLCAVLGQRFAMELRLEVYDRVERLSVAQATRLGLGSLITRLTVDVDSCSALVPAVLMMVLEPVLMMVGGIAAMWSITPTFGLVFVVFLALQLVVMTLFIRGTAPLFLKMRDIMDAMNNRLQNLLMNFRLIKASNTQAAGEAAFAESNQALYDTALAARKLVALFNPIIMLIMNLAVAGVLFLSGVRVARGALNVGLVLSAISYTEQVLLSMMTGGRIFKLIAETKPSAVRVCEVLDAPEDVPDGENALDAPFESLRFEAAGFGYPEGGRVFQGLDFSIAASEHVAVIGPVGSGKSTLAGLCARLFDVTDGRVLLNGQDIRSWRAADVRRTVALVEKQSAVLEGTIQENIAFGREDISEDAISRAAEAAQLSAYLAEKPGGLEAPMVSMGRGMSGGERQRLTIARALAGKPGLLVLDDSTSSLDYQTEARLLDALRTGYPDMAVLLVTNRIASAARADRILVLDGGRVAAQGTDESLRKESPLYRRMWASRGGEEASACR